MPSYSSLMGPETVGDAVQPLATLSEADFEAILSIVHSDRSFSPKKDEITILGERTQLGSSAIEYLFITLSFLYDHISNTVSSGLSYEEALSLTVEELSTTGNWNEPDKTLILKRMKGLLEPSRTHSEFKKIERIRSGFQPHAIGFSSIVELRPKFLDSDDGGLVIDGLIPSIEFRITTDAKDNKNHVFQLTEEALAEFRKAIDRLEKKVAAAKTADVNALKIIEL